MGLNELTGFVEDHWDYRARAMNLIQPLLQDLDEVIRMIAAVSLKNLRGKVEIIGQLEEFKNQYEEKVTKIHKVRVKKKDLDEAETMIQSYEGKVRFLRLAIYISLSIATALFLVRGISIPTGLMLGVFLLIFAYYKLIIVERIKKLQKLLAKKSK